MSTLVLGGSGLVGNAILQSGKFEQIITSYNKNSIKISGIKSFQCDLPKDFNKLNDIFEKYKPQILINVMGYSNIDFCENNKDDAYLLHVKTTEKISELSEKYNTKIIFLSSDYVFDGNKGNYTENDNPNPINYYGQTKLEAEKIVLRNKKNIVFRTSIIYDLDYRVRFFNYVFDNLKQKKSIEATNDVFNSVTLVDSVIQAIFNAINKDVSGIFHVVDSTCTNRLNFAKSVADIFNFDKNLIKEISIDQINPIAKRPKNACMDNSKAKRVLEIKFNTLEEGILKILKKKHE